MTGMLETNMRAYKEALSAGGFLLSRRAYSLSIMHDEKCELVHTLEAYDDDWGHRQGRDAPTELTASAREDFDKTKEYVRDAFEVCRGMGPGKAGGLGKAARSVLEHVRAIKAYPGLLHRQAP